MVGEPGGSTAIDDFVIRRAQPAESLAAAELWLRARKAAFPSVPAPVQSDDEVREWFASVLMNTTDVIVAVKADKLIGVMVINGPWLDQLYVDPLETGRGVGTHLLRYAMELRPNGLDLWTFQRNIRAQSFYRRHGFEVVTETDGDNEEGEPDVRYHWAGANFSD